MKAEYYKKQMKIYYTKLLELETINKNTRKEMINIKYSIRALNNLLVKEDDKEAK